MQTIKLDDSVADAEAYEKASQVLQQGGLVCFPCQGKYRLAADVYDQRAVLDLMQSKRRVGKAPALVFVSDPEMLETVAAEVNPSAKRLIDAYWPGHLTILFEANPELPRKVIKQLTRANGHIGVRIPDDPIALDMVKAFGGPLLISSANRENKAGNSSPAQVRKNFVHRVDLFLDAGDLTKQEPSTVVTVDGDSVKIIRAGSVSDESIFSVAG